MGREMLLLMDFVKKLHFHVVLHLVNKQVFSSQTFHLQIPYSFSTSSCHVTVRVTLHVSYYFDGLCCSLFINHLSTFSEDQQFNDEKSYLIKQIKEMVPGQAAEIPPV